MHTTSTAWMETALEDFLLDHEYYRQSSPGQFRQAFEDGFLGIILSISPYADQTLCEVHVGVRLDRVENIVFPFTNGTAAFDGSSLSLLCPLARLQGRSYDRYAISDQVSAEAAFAHLKNQLLDHGLPWLEDHSVIDALDSLYNDTPERAAFLTHNRLNRCLRAVTLARLLDRPDYRDIVEACRTELRVAHEIPQRVQRFEDLCRILIRYCEN